MTGCPICLDDESKLLVETNCRHNFCARCILSYWRLQGDWENGPIRCPICRQTVTKLLTSNDNESQVSLLNEYNNLIKSQKNFRSTKTRYHSHNNNHHHHHHHPPFTVSIHTVQNNNNSSSLSLSLVILVFFYMLSMLWWKRYKLR